MTQASNKRLSDKDREKLSSFAKAHIQCADEESNFETAYARAKAVVLAVVVKRFPVKDMKVLEKYGVAEPDNCIQFGGYYDRDGQFIFKIDDKHIPIVPKNTNCHRRQYEWTLEEKQVLNEYQLARQAWEKARDNKYQAYWRLIQGSATFNDVVNVWPAAEVMRSKIIPVTQEQRALAVLSEDVIAMIKRDNAGAQRVPA